MKPTFNGDRSSIDERRQNSGGSSLDVADLRRQHVENLNRVLVMRVELVANQTDDFAAADRPLVIAEADDVGDHETDEKCVGLRLRGGVADRRDRPAVQGHEQIHRVSAILVFHFDFFHLGKEQGWVAWIEILRGFCRLGGEIGGGFPFSWAVSKGRKGGFRERNTRDYTLSCFVISELTPLSLTGLPLTSFNCKFKLLTFYKKEITLLECPRNNFSFYILSSNEIE